MIQQGNQSDVARLRAQLDAECEAVRRVMSGFAEVAKHERITAHMENMERIHSQLKDIIGEQEATIILCQAMEGSEPQSQP